MVVIFVKKEEPYNEDVIFLGCYNDMKSCKQAIIKNVNEYIRIKGTSEYEIEDDESYYVVFDENTKEEKKKFFVNDCVVKVSVEIEEIK